MPRRPSAERAYRPLSDLQSGTNKNGGFFWRGYLSCPDKVLHIIAGKLLGWDSSRVAKHVKVQVSRNTVVRLWEKFQRTGQLGPLKKGCSGSQNSRSKLGSLGRLFLQLYTIR